MPFIAIFDDQSGRQVARFDLNEPDAKAVLGYVRGIAVSRQKPKTAQQPPGSPMPETAVRYPQPHQPVFGQHPSTGAVPGNLHPAVALNGPGTAGVSKNAPDRFANPKFRRQP